MDHDEAEDGDNHVLRLAGASMLVAAKGNELSKTGTKAPSLLSPQSASHVHTTLLNYLQAFQRNEDPGQDLIRDSRSTLTHSLNDVSTNEPHSIPFDPLDIGYSWPSVDVSSFPFNLANVNTSAQTDTAAACQGDAFLGQEVNLAPPGLSHGAVFGAVEEGSSVFQQFFADQMAALENSGPDQGWESFLSS